MKKGCLVKWLDALKSEKYSQIRGALHTEKGYCPIGVLCDISACGEWKKINSPKMEYLGQINYIPAEVIQWAGMDSEEAKMLEAFLIVVNDFERMSFAELVGLLVQKYHLNDTD